MTSTRENEPAPIDWVVPSVEAVSTFTELPNCAEVAEQAARVLEYAAGLTDVNPCEELDAD